MQVADFRRARRLLSVAQPGERMSAPGIWERGHTVESILGVLTSPNREDEPVWREKTEQSR